MARSASPLVIILAAARDGRVTAAGARRWARRAAAGESVEFVARLAKAGPRVTGADLARLTNDLASILGGGPLASPARDLMASSRAGEMTDAEADLLYPPRTPDAAEQRFTAAEAERAARNYTDAELHRELFGDHVHAAAPLHAPFTGTHTHAHPAYSGLSAAGTHEHEHDHSGDASHDHHSGQSGQVGQVQR